MSKTVFLPYAWVVEFGSDLRAFFRVDEDARALKFAITHDRGSAVIEHGVRMLVYRMIEVPDPPQESACDSPLL